ncbi:HAD family hydrolase [Pedobacter sp. AW1-32]|uniref:HAD family hydrolase n=1 Tax=Pedobacter sp. AW1-32 TaxID=3383026 RepID=UPI003FED3F7D
MKTQERMAFYKHYSFDLWLTLIKSNPSFKQERAAYFHQKFNPKNKPLEEVIIIFRRVDLMVNAINEKTGKNVDADEMYLMVISMMNDFEVHFQIDLPTLELEMEELLLNHMPLIYSDSTLETLSALKNNSISTTNILSNTGFIRGKTLRKVVYHLGIDCFIDFQLYSDEVRMSKPNPGFFQLMLDGINRDIHSDIKLSEILHVGDNPVADIGGAEAAGIHSLLINSNDLSILNLLYDSIYLRTSQDRQYQ